MGHYFLVPVFLFLHSSVYLSPFSLYLCKTLDSRRQQLGFNPPFSTWFAVCFTLGGVVG